MVCRHSMAAVPTNYLAKLTHLIRSSEGLHFYYGNIFEDYGVEIDFCNKSLSNFEILGLVYERSRMQNINRFLLQINIRVLLAVQFKRCLANAYTFCIVIYKFCYFQEPCPIFMYLTNKILDKRGNFTYLSLRLPIGLTVECHKKLLLNAKKVIKQRPKLGYKN